MAFGANKQTRKKARASLWGGAKEVLVTFPGREKNTRTGSDRNRKWSKPEMTGTGNDRNRKCFESELIGTGVT